MSGALLKRARARLAPREPSPWTSILANSTAESLETGNGADILCATSVGGAALTRVVDSLVAMGLHVRGARPSMLLCDAALPACEACRYIDFPQLDEFVRSGPKERLCGPCFDEGEAFYAPLPVPVRRYREFVGDADIRRARNEAGQMSVNECFLFERDGLALGEQVRAATLRFFGKADLANEPIPLVEAAARRFSAGALVAAIVGERVLAKLQPACVVAHHGVYVPQGVLGEVARRDGVRVVNWGPSYRNTTVIYSHGDTYHRTLIAEPEEAWAGNGFDPRSEAQLLEYLTTRRGGGGDWQWVTSEAGLRPEIHEQGQLTRELALDPSRPLIGLLTNVLWDAQLYYQGHAFTDMLDWLWTTLDFFTAHPELQLIVRIHPHEVKSGNRQPVEPEIRRRYPHLPENIKIVAHDHPFNTYALMSLCRAVLIYGTKTGVELTPLGMPVVVAGDAWIRGKGLTTDVSSREDYKRVLEQIGSVRPLAADVVKRARAYAHHYFFRRMIPLRSIDPESAAPQLRIDDLADLLPGYDAGLDVICEGILTGAPFIFDG